MGAIRNIDISKTKSVSLAIVLGKQDNLLRFACLQLLLPFSLSPPPSPDWVLSLPYVFFRQLQLFLCDFGLF